MRVAAIALFVGLLSGYSWPIRWRDRAQERARISGALSTPGVAMDGHSILYGTYAEAAYHPPVLVRAQTNLTTPETFAVPGSTAAQCADRITTILAGNYNYVVWQCAVNDIQNARTGINIFRDSTKAALDSAVAANKKVILNDELPCNGVCSDAGVEEVQNYNLMAHAWCDINPTMAVCLRDFADFGAVADPTYLKSTYAAFDNFHLNDAGYALLSTGDSNLIIDGGYYACTSADNLFDFASGTGSSLGAACADADITSVDGGAVTTTRAGTAYCSKKGFATTGIATGDIVAVSANKPRVQPGYDGTSLGVLREKSGTNTTTAPTAMGAAPWATQGVVVAAPTVTTGQTDPTGGTSGVRLDLAATNGGGTQGSLIYNLTGCVQGTVSASLYVKGVSGSGSFDMCVYDSAGGNDCVSCAYTNASWSRCVNNGFAQSDVSGGYFLIGNADYYNPAPVARPAQSIVVWGAQCEASSYVTSFMNTTRGAETMTASVTSSAQTQAISVVYEAPSSLTAGDTLFQYYKDANNDVKGYATPSTLTCDYRKGGSSNTVVSTGSNITVSAANTAVCWFSNAVEGAKVNSTADYFNLTLRTNTISTGAQELNIGGRHAAGNEPNGLIRNLTVWNKAGCR